jgi:repressor LexA
MAKGLTEKQRKILEFVIDFQRENGFPPTIREIGESFSIGSLRGVTVHLDALVRKGFISRGRTSRSIRLTAPDPRDPTGAVARQQAGTRLPLVTSLAEGAAEPAEAQVERFVAVPEDIAAPAVPGGFLIRVGAAGLPGDPILPGDLVVVRPQESATPGDLVAVRQDGGLAVRRASESDPAIVGRVVGLLRR